jgi:hypothetical protein
MSYAANLGRDRIIAMLRELGADDLNFAFDRACLQGRIDTARALYAMGARPDADSVAGPCETQCATGLAYLVEIGAAIRLEHIALLLQTYSRIRRANISAWSSPHNAVSRCPTRHRWRSTEAE